MRTLTIRRGMLLGLGLAATLSMAACTATKAPNIAASRSGPPPASHTPAATTSPPAAAPQASLWLAPSEIPFYATYHWSLFTGRVTESGRETPIGTPEGNGVYYVSPDTVLQAITFCGRPSLTLQPLGARQRLFEPTTGTIHDRAGQWITSYPDATAAQAAWRARQATYAECLADMPTINSQITLTETAQTQDGMAWFHTTSGAMIGSVEPYEHEYFVLHENQIAYVSVAGGGNALATVPDDAQILATIARHLATPVGVQNRVISSTERSTLTAAFVAHKGISLTDVLGGGPIKGSVYYAYDPATDTYWALATFEPSLTASLNVQVSFQDGEGTGMYRKTGASPWQVQTSVWPPICGELRFFPAAVLRVWTLPTTPQAGLTC